MKQIFFLGGLALCLAACNAHESGTGGNPSQDTVVPVTEGKGFTEDKGTGSTKGGSSDPLNGGGPQTLNNKDTSGGNLMVAPNTDTAANKRTPTMQKAGEGKKQ